MLDGGISRGRVLSEAEKPMGDWVCPHLLWSLVSVRCSGIHRFCLFILWAVLIFSHKIPNREYDTMKLLFFLFVFFNAYFSCSKYSNVTSTFIHNINLFKSFFLKLLRIKLLVHIWSFLGRYLFKIKPKQELCRHTSLSWSDWIVLPLCKYNCSVWEQPTKQATEAGLWWNHTLS